MSKPGMARVADAGGTCPSARGDPGGPRRPDRRRRVAGGPAAVARSAAPMASGTRRRVGPVGRRSAGPGRRRTIRSERRRSSPAPGLHRELAHGPGRGHLDPESLPAPLGQLRELLDHRHHQAGRHEDQQVEQPLVQRCLAGPRRLGQPWSAPRQTQSRQSIFFRSASWLGCLTRKHERHTNSPGCLGSTRSTPSPDRSSGSGVSSSSSASSTTSAPSGWCPGWPRRPRRRAPPLPPRRTPRRRPAWWPAWPRPRATTLVLVDLDDDRRPSSSSSARTSPSSAIRSSSSASSSRSPSMSSSGSFDFVEFLWHLGLSVVSWPGA